MNQPLFNRRQLLQVGGLGLLGVSLPKLLWAGDYSNPDPRKATADACIFIIASGGPSHLDTFDPKPSAPSEIRGLYDVVRTRTPGTLLADPLPKLADVSNLYCLVRSFSHREVPHVTAAHMLLTGQSDGSRKDNTPLISSLATSMRPSTANMPSNVWLHNMKTGTQKIPRYNSGLDILGYDHAAMRIGYELDNPTSPDFRVRHFDPTEGMTRDRIADRLSLLNRLEPPERPLPSSDEGKRLTAFHERALDIVTSDRARGAFALEQEPEKVRDRYGRHPIGQYCLMARRLVESGVRLVTVTAWPGLAPGETEPTVTQVWDTHGIRYSPGDSMYGNGPFGMKWSLPRLDQGVSALLEDLHQRGMLERTLVVLMSEFGRTPKFENDNRGRGHWPYCFSGLLAGGGVHGGTTYGQSDRIGAYVARGRALSFDDFGATIYNALGIPPETRYGPDSFSLKVSHGEPLREIFS